MPVAHVKRRPNTPLLAAGYLILFLRGHITGENTDKIVSFCWEEEIDFTHTKIPNNKLIFNGV